VYLQFDDTIILNICAQLVRRAWLYYLVVSYALKNMDNFLKNRQAYVRKLASCIK